MIKSTARQSLKTTLMLTMSISLFSLFGCGSGYSEKDGKIMFNGKEITDKSFKVLNSEFAKDSSTVYYKEYPFSYADVPTFEALDEHYAKDKNKAYYCDEYREGQNYYMTKKQTISEIENALPTSFTVLKNAYAKDGKRAYFQGAPFAVKDVSSFESIDPFF
jgi:hypothetical protein